MAGEDDGFCAYIMILPEDGAGVFVASNWDDTDIESVAYELLDALLEPEPSAVAAASEADNE